MEFDAERWRRARTEGDPLADSCIASVFRDGDVDRLNQLLLRMHESPWALDGFLAEVDDYFEQSRQLPDWYDQGLVERGERVFFEFGFVSILVLWAASLPECYRIPEEARVLTLAGNLVASAERRIHKTARFVFPVMTPGGIRQGGPGIPYAQKVRLIHAAIRHLLLQPIPPELAPHEGSGQVASRLLAQPWDASRDGVPINHWQLAYTLLTFSHVMLRGYKKIGITVDEQDQLGYVHLWNVVGHLLGIPRELMVDTPEQQAALFSRLQQDARVTEEGRMLTKATLRALSSRWPKSLVPVASAIGPVVSRRILGAVRATELGVASPSSAYSVWAVEAALNAVVRFDRFTDRLTSCNAAQEAILRLARTITETVLSEAVDDDDYALQLPDELLGRWRVRPARGGPARGGPASEKGPESC